MLIDRLRKDMKKNIDLRYKKGSENFFREKIKSYGVRTPIVRNIARKYFKEIKNSNKRHIFNLCEELLKTNYNEEATIAFSWCYEIRERLEKEDFKTFESWVKRYLTNWAMVDDFCTHSVGFLVMKYPELIKNLKEWTKSDNLWVRRASAVTLIHCVKRKSHLDESFIISNILMNDKEDLVRKGYGWLLKEASNNYQKEVFDYVIKNKNKMPRTALRYAIEKMPEKLRFEAMREHTIH